MDIKEISKEIRQINLKNGFDSSKSNIGELLMLVTSELAEALEADRKEYFTKKEDMDITIREFQYHKQNQDNVFKHIFESHIKNTFNDEISDAVIRLLDICEALNIDIETHILLKLEYNKLREFKHGKKY